jgi:hypothetical protein
VPSVTVSWSGKCPNHTTQEDLCRKLEGLAELSHGYFEEPKPAVKYFDQTIEGEILLSGHVFGDNTTIPQALKVAQRKSEEDH